jgi:hypothetical protein
MKLKQSLYIFLTVFATSFFVASCLNKDNKIPPNCYDGEKNNGEVGKDCGGPCPECNHCTNGVWDPTRGETWVDCGGECPPCTQCWNGIQDGDETGIDCGGSCNRACASLCTDGLLNGDESEIDCGGACPACATCTDGILNGTEVGIDCGGVNCPPCSTDNNCTNNSMDGDEFWVDCGGTICPRCKDTLYWVDPVSLTSVYAGVLNRIVNNAASLTVTGTSADASTVTFTIPRSNASAPYYNLALSPYLVSSTTAPSITLAYTFAGVTYSSANIVTPALPATITIQRYVYSVPLSREFFRVLFSGTLFDTTGASIDLSGGVFMYTQNL